MRYDFSEFAPSGKRQYRIALGVRDIEILMALASAARQTMPVIPGNDAYNEVRSRIRSMTNAFSNALADAERLEDDGDRRAPWGAFGNDD